MKVEKPIIICKYNLQQSKIENIQFEFYGEPSSKAKYYT